MKLIIEKCYERKTNRFVYTKIYKQSKFYEKWRGISHGQRAE